MQQKSLFSRALAMPAPGRQPTFDDVVNIALVGAQCDLAVQVLCLRHTLFRRWQRRLETPVHADRAAPLSATAFPFPPGTQAIRLQEISAYTLPELCHQLRQTPQDLVILSGFQRALARGAIAPDYVTALLEAAPTGTTILA